MKKAIESCPKCGTKHERQEFKKYIEPHSEHHGSKEGTYVCAPDVKCKCGLELGWVVPFFRSTESGYQLTVKPDYRKFRE